MKKHNQISIPVNKFLDINKNLNYKQIVSLTIDNTEELYDILKLDETTGKTNIIQIKDNFNRDLKYNLIKNEDEIKITFDFYKSSLGINTTYILLYILSDDIDFVTSDDIQENLKIEELQDLTFDFTTEQFKQNNDITKTFEIIGDESNINVYSLGQGSSQTRPQGINIFNNGYNNTFTVLDSKIDLSTFIDGILVEVDFFEFNEFDNQVFMFLKNYIDSTEPIIIRFEKHYEYKKLFFDFLYQEDFYSWYSNDVSEKISIDEEKNNKLQIRYHNNKIIFYCNNKYLFHFNISPTEFSLKDFLFQIGLINSFSGRSSFNVSGLRFYSIYNSSTIYYEDDFEDTYINHSLILDNNDYKIIPYEKIVDFSSPSKLYLTDSKLPYFIDMENYIGGNYIDVQFKNYITRFSKRVTILNKVLYESQKRLDIEDFIWRQLTPMFVREKTHENNDYVWTEFVHVMGDLVQKLDTLSDKFGDLFHPFQTDMYLKKTFYFRLKEINVLKKYFNLIENNKQIFTLLSLEFFKEIMQYYVNRGTMEQITNIFNNQFKNISQSLELYLFYFSKKSDIQILPYQYPTKMEEFNLFIKSNGLAQIFEKQKIQLYDKNKDYINSFEKQVFKNFKYKRRTKKDYMIENQIDRVTNNLLSNQVYRHVIVVMSTKSLQYNDMKESLTKFFSFIKDEFLPQNMDFLFIEKDFKELDIENQNIFDFTQIKYNSVSDSYSFFKNLKEQNLTQGKLKEDIKHETGKYINSPYVIERA